MLEVRAASFARDVLEASREVPVLVDFWAPWCGPCRALGPLLERIEAESDGGFRLVKINSDEEPELAAQFKVRSIPYVVAFVDGRAVDAFVGVQPESQIRAFVARLRPDPAQLERRKAAALVAEGRLEEAASALRAAITLAPGDPQAQLDLAELLIHRLPGSPDPARLEEADAALKAAAARAGGDPRLQALATALEGLRQAAALPPADALAARVAADPADLAARLDLAHRLMADRRRDDALEHLLQIVERDRGFRDDIGRKTMLAIFESAADQPQWVAAWRRRLAAALNR